MKKRKKEKSNFSETKETWGFYFFDKIIIAAIAACLIIIFQSMAHRHQVIFDSRLSVGKTYTDIILKYRDNMHETMSDYFKLIQEVKYNKKLDKAKGEKDKIDQYASKVNLYKQALFTIIDLHTKRSKNAGRVNREDNISVFKKEADEFITKKFTLNQKLMKPSFHESDITRDTNELQEKYLNFLDKLREVTLEIMEQEMTKYSKYSLWKFLWSSISGYDYLKVNPNINENNILLGP
jgi:hypothetical protein